MTKRPWGITLNTVFLVLAGIMLLIALVGITAVSPWIADTIPMLGAIASAFIILLVMTVIVFLLAFYLWKGNEYAWWILSILLILGIILNVLSLFITQALPLVSLMLQAVLLLGLWHKQSISFVDPEIQWNGWELKD